VDSTEVFLMMRERSRSTLQMTVAKLRRIDHISIQHSSIRAVRRQIAGQGRILRPRDDQLVLVNGSPIWKLPVDVTLVFTPSDKYTEERRSLGRLMYSSGALPEMSAANHAPRLALQLYLPLELAARFDAGASTPLISVGVTGIQPPASPATRGLGPIAWDASAEPKLVVDECIVSDPVPGENAELLSDATVPDTVQRA
jgi:hypothetical protein